MVLNLVLKLSPEISTIQLNHELNPEISTLQLSDQCHDIVTP